MYPGPTPPPAPALAPPPPDVYARYGIPGFMRDTVSELAYSQSALAGAGSGVALATGAFQRGQVRQTWREIGRQLNIEALPYSPATTDERYALLSRITAASTALQLERASNPTGFTRWLAGESEGGFGRVSSRLVKFGLPAVAGLLGGLPAGIAVGSAVAVAEMTARRQWRSGRPEVAARLKKADTKGRDPMMAYGNWDVLVARDDRKRSQEEAARMAAASKPFAPRQIGSESGDVRERDALVKLHQRLGATMIAQGEAARQQARRDRTERVGPKIATGLGGALLRMVL